MIKILIADDHAIVRQGLKQIVADASELEVAGEAQNAKDVFRLVREQTWDLVILDMAMPGRDGLDILKQLKYEWPSLPVLILSMYPEEQFAVRTLKAGAAGYVTKESATEELVKAIRKVLQGGRYVSQSLAERLAFHVNVATEKLPHETLSDREYQVLCLIASGKTVGEIAEHLSLSATTVSTYRARVLEKMGMKNSAELTHYAIQQHLVR